MRKSCQSQPHWSDIQIIKGEGNNRMVLSSFPDSRKNKACPQPIQNEVLGKKVFLFPFSVFFSTSSCDFAGKQTVIFLWYLLKKIFHWKFGSVALKLKKKKF